MRIHGYYCIHPEQVDESRDVAFPKQRLEKLIKLGAPEIILANERRVYNEAKAFHADLSQFRACIKKLYIDGNENDILSNYDIIFQDLGFDPSLAYSGMDTGYDPDKRDYLKPLENLPDDAVLGFIAYTQRKFDEYLEKYTPKLNEIRDKFIYRIKQFVAHKRYPESVLNNLERLEQATIEIDDGFETTIDGNSGWYNANQNIIVLSARVFDGQYALVLFHECFHALAGITDDVSGFNRLETFFGEDFEDAFELLNENFVNAQSICVLTSNPSQRLKDEQYRDLITQLIITHTGTKEIPQEVFFNAYFSDDIDDVKILADAIKTAFDSVSLFDDLQSIRNIKPTDYEKYKGRGRSRGKGRSRHGVRYRSKHRNRNRESNKMREFFYEHRLDNIDTYFFYRCENNPRLKENLFFLAFKLCQSDDFARKVLRK